MLDDQVLGWLVGPDLVDYLRSCLIQDPMTACRAPYAGQSDELVAFDNLPAFFTYVVGQGVFTVRESHHAVALIYFALCPSKLAER